GAAVDAAFGRPVPALRRVALERRRRHPLALLGSRRRRRAQCARAARTATPRLDPARRARAGSWRSCRLARAVWVSVARRRRAPRPPRPPRRGDLPRRTRQLLPPVRPRGGDPVVLARALSHGGIDTAPQPRAEHPRRLLLPRAAGHPARRAAHVPPDDPSSPGALALPRLAG